MHARARALIYAYALLVHIIPVDSGGVPLGDTDSLTDDSVKPSRMPQVLHELAGIRGFTVHDMHIVVHTEVRCMSDQ